MISSVSVCILSDNGASSPAPTRSQEYPFSPIAMIYQPPANLNKEELYYYGELWELREDKKGAVWCVVLVWYNTSKVQSLMLIADM
jgi:hypothetical protein